MLKILSDYGADVCGAMVRLLDDEDLYLECIKLFLYDENFPALKQALACSDKKNAFEYAHALKGVAANLGLTPIFTTISGIVEYIRNTEDANFDDLYKDIEVERKKLIQIMESK